MSGQHIVNIYLHIHCLVSLSTFLRRFDGLEVSLQSPDSSLSDQLLQPGENIGIQLFIQVKPEAPFPIVDHHVTYGKCPVGWGALQLYLHHTMLLSEALEMITK